MKFKVFNDSRGHKAGDDVLRRVARAVEKRSRRVDLVARYGGDEFVVALLGTGTGAAPDTAERIRLGIREESTSQGAMTVSIGVATYPDDAGAKAELIDKADWAMYAAKRDGGDRVVAFKKATTPEA